MKVTEADRIFTVREKICMVHLAETAVVRTRNGVTIEVIDMVAEAKSLQRRGIRTKTTKVLVTVIADMIIGMSISAQEALEIIAVREEENGHEINTEEKETAEVISMSAIKANDKTTEAGLMVKRRHQSQNPIPRKSLEVVHDLEVETDKGEKSIETITTGGMMQDAVISNRSKINQGKTFVMRSIEEETIVIGMAQTVADMTTMMKNVMVLHVEVAIITPILDPEKEKTKSKACDLQKTQEMNALRKEAAVKEKQTRRMQQALDTKTTMHSTWATTGTRARIHGPKISRCWQKTTSTVTKTTSQRSAKIKSTRKWLNKRIMKAILPQITQIKPRPKPTLRTHPKSKKVR